MAQQLISRIALGLYYFLWVVSGALYLRFLLSWFVDPFNRFLQLLVTLTEPFVMPVRMLMQRLMRGEMRLDFSLLITSFLINLLQRIVIMFMY